MAEAIAEAQDVGAGNHHAVIVAREQRIVQITLIAELAVEPIEIMPVIQVAEPKALHQKDAQEIVSRSQIKLEAKDLEQSDQEASVQEVKTRQEMPAIIQGMPEEVEVAKRV